MKLEIINNAVDTQVTLGDPKTAVKLKWLGLVNESVDDDFVCDRFMVLIAGRGEPDDDVVLDKLVANLLKCHRQI